MIVTRLAYAVMLAFGWRRAIIAFLAGVASALALAPINAWPILFLTFPVLIWLVDGSAAGRWSGAMAAAVAGWCFGFGYFLAGLYWVGYAFLVDAKTFGWLLPVAVAGLPAYLALFTALGLAAARLIWVRGPERVLALATMLTASEWLRGHLLSGFPWNTFGYALTEPLALAQSVSLVGIWGLTFLCIAICASPAVLADDLADTAHPRRAPFIGVLILAGLASYGVARLWQHPTAYVSGVKLRVMQPNLQQDEKFNYAAKAQVMERYLRLSDRATGPNSNGVHDVTHLIWPESAFPFFLTREPDALAQITALLKPSTELITGAVRAAPTAGSTGSNFVFGVCQNQTGTGARVFDEADTYTSSDTLFVGGDYQINPGANNDTAKLYVYKNPGNVDATEPGTAQATSDDSLTLTGDVSTGGNGFESFFLRNNGLEPTGTTIDEVKAGTTWADVIPEPTSIGLLGLALPLMARRRRKS